MTEEKNKQTELLKRYEFAAKSRIPLDYVIYNNKTKKYENITDFIPIRKKKKADNEDLGLDNLLSKLRDNYTVFSFYTFFALWFLRNITSQTHKEKEYIFEFLAPHKSILGTTKTGVAYGDEAERYAATFDVETRKTLEQYLKLNAISKIDKIKLHSRLVDAVHDTITKEITSVFNTIEDRTPGEVFDSIEIDADVPFVMYQDDVGRIQVRIHTTAESQVPTWAKLSNSFAPPIAKGRLIAVIRYETSSYKEGNSKPYTLLHYLPDPSYKRVVDARYQFSYATPLNVKNLDELQARIIDHLGLRTEGARTSNVKAAFTILDVVIIPELLLHILASDSRFFPLLYVKEQSRSVAEKKRLTLYYEASSTSKCMLTFKDDPEYAKTTYVYYIDKVPKKYHKQIVLQVKLAQATNNKTIVDVKNIFVKLISVYLNQVSILKDLYESLFGIQLTEPKPKKEVKDLTNLEKNQIGNPTIFQGQGRSYQTDAQVTLITTEIEVATDPEAKRKLEAAKQEFTIIPGPKGEVIKEPRQILLENGVYYTSYIDGKPYIGYKEAASTKGKRLPHCYARKKLNIDPDTCKLISVITNTGKKKQRKTTASNPVNTLKLLHADGTGQLPKTLAQVLKVHTKDVVNTDGKEDTTRIFLRFSRVHYTSSSLLHQVLAAIDDKEYLHLPVEKVIEYGEKIRREELPQFAVACRQECYDMTTEMIAAELGGTGYLDPQKYYRALEEFAYKRTKRHYRIYTLIPKNECNNDDSLMIPRYKLFHARNYKDKSQPIIIFAHYGLSSDAADFPECDLVIMNTSRKTKSANSKTTKMMNRVIQSNMLRKHLQDLLKNVTSVRRLEYISPQNVDEDTNGAVLSVVKDPQDLPTVRSLFSDYEVISQQIDDYGKLRVLRLKKNGTSSSTSVVVYTPPLAPVLAVEENLFGEAVSFSSAIKFLRSLDVKDIYYSARETEDSIIVESLHGYVGSLIDPISLQIEESDDTDTTDLIREDFMKLPIANKGEKSVIGKLQRLKIALSDIMRYIHEKYVDELEQIKAEIEEKEDNEDEDEEEEEKVKATVDSIEFIDKYTTVINDYSYEDGPFTEEKEGYGKKQVIIKKVILDSERLKRNLYSYAERFLKFNRVLPASLLYAPSRDIGKEVIYIPDAEQLARWVGSILYKDELNNAHTGIRDESLLDTQQPYYLKDLENRLYILQKVRGDTLARAQACSYNFQRFNNNTGWSTLPSSAKWEATNSQELHIKKVSGSNETVEIKRFTRPDEVGIIVSVLELPVPCGSTDTTQKWAALLYIGNL